MKANHFERLTFGNGKFQLSEVSTPALRLKLSKNAHWKNIGNDSYQTESLGAAAIFRDVGDETTEKLFSRRFQAHYQLPKLPPLPMLDPHQIEGVKWILSRKRSYLAHAPGAGKTITSLVAACLASGSGQNIFIVPPGLTLNWEREIWKVTDWFEVPFPTIGVVRSSAEQNRVAWKAEFLIVPDSMITKPWVHTRLRKIKKKVLVVDEASRFKESTSQKSLALYGGSSGEKAYRNLFQDARHVVFMDGSPMPNRPIELWAPSYALHPEAIDCRSFDDFGYRYCGAKPDDRGVWQYLYSSNEEELKQKLQEDFMHVVTEKELTHPERLRRMVWMDKDVRTAEYRSWQERFIPPASFNDELSTGEIAHFRKELGISKTKWVADYVHRILKDKNESILLFAWHRDVIRDLEVLLAFWDPLTILGGTSAAVRERNLKAFQDGSGKLLILNIAAAGRGHNLQRANRVVFAEWSWTDELNKQCEHRTARRGSEEFAIPCDYIVAPNSLDERTLRSVFSKQRRVRRIIG